MKRRPRIGSLVDTVEGPGVVLRWVDYYTLEAQTGDGKLVLVTIKTRDGTYESSART